MIAFRPLTWLARVAVALFLMGGISAEDQSGSADKGVPKTTAPSAPRSGQRSYKGSIASADSANKTITVRTSEGDVTIKVTSETNIHLVRPGDESNITSNTYGLVTGSFSPDRKSIEAKSMTIYYAKGIMADYVSPTQARGTLRREGTGLTVQVNTPAFSVQLAKPLRVMVSSQAQFVDLKESERVEIWALHTPEGIKAQLVFIIRT